MKKSPVKVSVLTPLFDTDPVFLKEMIDSILNQTYKNFEFILLNDSPWNKNIRELVETYSDPRIIFIENKENIGISASRNELLKFSKGEYLAIFDHDDISCPNRLEKQVEFLDRNKDIGVVGCFTKRIPEDVVTIYPIENLSIKCELLNSCAIPHTGAMIRKSILEENNLMWEEEFSPAEDYMLWVRLIEKTMFYNIPEVLVHYRNYSDNTTAKKNKKMCDRDAIIRSIALKEYPFFKTPASNGIAYKRWFLLFGFIPFIKVKSKHNLKNFYLFGFLKIFSLKDFNKKI